MTSEIILGTIIAGLFTIIGIIVQRIDTNLSERREHFRNLERIKIELTFKEKIKIFKETSDILYEIRARAINLVLGIERETGPIEELISKFNKKSFLFIGKESIKILSQNIEKIRNIIIDPPRIIEKIENNIPIPNNEKLEKLISNLGYAQGNILLALRKELNI